jgi:hypothetical protein
MKKIFITALTCLLIAGCAGKAPRVYWGGYSETLYDLKKEPSEATASAHTAELEEIIAKSDSWRILPPPGVCAELGKTYFEQGKKDLARQLINKETEHYPESKALMSRLIKNIDEQGS